MRRLQALFAADEEKWRADLAARESTKASRLDGMRARVTELKGRREAERQAYVQTKVLQQFRAGADELRTLQSKMCQDKVARDRGQQLVEQAEQRTRDVAEERVYAAQWEEDRQRKIRREQQDLADQKARDAQTNQVLQEQLRQLQIKAEQELALKAEEARLMVCHTIPLPSPYRHFLLLPTHACMSAHIPPPLVQHRR
jgi:hypothetical protein